MSLGSILERFLRRARPKDPAALDRLVLAQLRGLGADLTQPRHVRHFLYFEDERNARLAAGEIERAGYDVTTTPPNEAAPWTVVAEAYRVVGPDTVAAFRAWFEQMAADRDGEYDGWEPATKP